MRPKFVEVKWKDSWTNSDAKWTSEELKKEPDLILYSCGYLMHKDKRGVNIAAEYREEQRTARHVHHIPAKMVLSLKEIAKARK